MIPRAVRMSEKWVKFQTRQIRESLRLRRKDHSPHALDAQERRSVGCPLHMRRSAPAVLAIFLGLSLSGCAGRTPAPHSPSSGADARLEALETRMESMENELVELRSLRERFDALTESVQEIALVLARLEGGQGGAAGTQDRGRAEHGPDHRFAVQVQGHPSVGPKHAKVTVVQVFEFACAFCEHSRETMDALRKAYGNEVRVVYRHFIVHPEQATRPALAACAAAKQGKFEPVMNGIWEKAFGARDFSDAVLMAVAIDAGVKDMRRFQRDMDGICVREVAADQRFFTEIGVTGTPTFFVNGRKVIGAQPLTRFVELIDEEKAAADQALSKGAKLKTYYDKLVLGNAAK